MTLMEHFSGLANAVSKFEADLKAHILALAKHLSIDGTSVKVQISPDLSAEINPLNGSILVNNAPVGDVTHLLGAAKALGAELEKHPSGIVPEAILLAEKLAPASPVVKALEVASPILTPLADQVIAMIEKDFPKKS